MFECDAVVVGYGTQQGERSVAALRHKAAARRDKHPCAIVLQSARPNAGLQQIDHTAGLQRVDVK
jgi:hypothetical protein